jgi:small subunit ribosomal protein S20
MANIKSQIKRNRQNEIQRMRNKSVHSNLKTSVKKVEAAASAGEPTDELLRAAQAKIDTAVSKGVLHKRTAARKKSRLTARVASSK